MKKNLAQYFDSYTPNSLSITEKAAIYKNFLEKKQRSQNNSWIRIYKSIAYSISTLAVISVILFGNFFGLFDQKPAEIGQFVVAQTIGKILNTQGTFTIYNKDNRPIAGDSIELTDRVVVDENSQVNILVHDSFIAQISGPAQFEIILNEDNNGYNLKFINGGDNIAINSIAETSKNISVQTSDGVTIRNNENNQKLSFSVQKKPGASERSIINQSNASIEISETTSMEDKVLIQPRHSINFVKESNKNIQIISQQEIVDTTETQTDTKHTTKPISNNSVPDEVRHIITNDDIKTLKLILEKAFLKSEYNDLVMNYLIGKDNEYKVTIANIKKRLDRIAPIANIEPQSVTSLTDAAHYANTLIKGLEAYGVRPEIYNNLIVMINKFNELIGQEYGFLQDTNKRKPITTEFINTMYNFNNSESYTYL